MGGTHLETVVRIMDQHKEKQVTSDVDYCNMSKVENC